MVCVKKGEGNEKETWKIKNATERNHLPGPRVTLGYLVNDMACTAVTWLTDRPAASTTRVTLSLETKIIPAT